jgi:hypothetical protein
MIYNSKNLREIIIWQEKTHSKEWPFAKIDKVFKKYVLNIIKFSLLIRYYICWNINWIYRLF